MVWGALMCSTAHQQRALLPHGVQEGLQVGGRQQELQQLLRTAQRIRPQRLCRCITDWFAPFALQAAGAGRTSALVAALGLEWVCGMRHTMRNID
jgi:hypothetical protein